MHDKDNMQGRHDEVEFGESGVAEALVTEKGMASFTSGFQPHFPYSLTIHAPAIHHLPNHVNLYQQMDSVSKKRKAEPDERDKGGWNKKPKVSCFLLYNHEDFRSILSWHRNPVLVLQMELNSQR